MIDEIIQIKKNEKVSDSTINRMLEIISAILNNSLLYELQKLGGWSSYETVQRYAHLNSQQLQDAAERVSGTKLVHENR